MHRNKADRRFICSECGSKEMVLATTKTFNGDARELNLTCFNPDCHADLGIWGLRSPETVRSVQVWCCKRKAFTTVALRHVCGMYREDKTLTIVISGWQAYTFDFNTEDACAVELDKLQTLLT